MSSDAVRSYQLIRGCGLGFGNDPLRARLKLAGLTVERQNGTEYAQKRFHSKAPIHTDQHEQLLIEFEQILAP